MGNAENVATRCFYCISVECIENRRISLGTALVFSKQRGGGREANGRHLSKVNLELAKRGNQIDVKLLVLLWFSVPGYSSCPLPPT
jgi:hypothetical protein